MKPTADDFIAALESQRNDALNQLVNAAAQVASLHRIVQSQKDEIAALTKAVAESSPKAEAA